MTTNYLYSDWLKWSFILIGYCVHKLLLLFFFKKPWRGWLLNDTSKQGGLGACGCDVKKNKRESGPAQLRYLMEANVWGRRGYLDLDLSIDLRSLLSGSSFLGSRGLESCRRFSSPSSSDLISELTEEVLWPWRPPDRAAAARQDQQREFMDGWR